LNQSTLRSRVRRAFNGEYDSAWLRDDFRLSRQGTRDFLAVEVKGIREKAGSVLLTRKNTKPQPNCQNNFYLFVVKNFQKEPYHELFLNPIAGKLQFTRTERVLVQVSWLTAFKEQNQ